VSEDRVVIRRVETQAEYDECVRIEDETWGAGFNERVPSTILKVAQYLGGVTAAAFDGARGPMLGFVFGMTGVQNGRLVHWSDLLAVRPEARDRGLGRRLKLYQRSLVLELGVTRMLWTYDPLVARNAHLNLNALGAAVAEYVPEMYGSDTGSALHDEIGTDRFVVAWELTTGGATVPTPPAGAPALAPPASLVVDLAMPRVPDSAPELYVAIPDDIQHLIATAPTTARAWRESTRSAFLHYLGNGYRVSGFLRTSSGGFYRLSKAAD
jgi:predicted GNAT superfamily acetyltransferase